MSEWAKDFDLLVQKINQCLNSYDRSNGISSIDVLFPFDYNLTSLLQLRAANPNSNYLKAINEFLFNGSDSIQRSLYYQEYDGFFKHKSSKQVSISSNSNVLKFYDPQIIPDPKNKKIKDLRLLDDFWEAFCQAIFKHGVGSTVFWCLIKIDPSNHTSKIYASAYLVIKHPICDENNIAIIHIDKLLKEYLTRHTINILFSGILENTTKSATSRIINRNYAHHIGSHVSHRATADKIYERVFGNYDLKIEEKDFATILKSIVEMENRLTRYKDERNEFISGIESNTHPVPVMFYKDIIQPFIENSLLIDNIAKSEGICWESDDQLKNDGKVKEKGISKLRIRVFYHKEIIHENDKILECELKDCCCAEEVPCLYKNDENKTLTDRLSFSDLGIDNNWLEMMAVYNLENKIQTTDKNKNKEQKNTCIHRLPYFKKLFGKDGKFYRDIDYTLADIEVAMPGTLGSQSIYSLLENHIRNTAKHASSSTVSSKMPVNIIIKISKRKDRNDAEDPDFYNMELTSNIPTIHEQSHKTKIEEALIEPIDGDTKALGFADMRINATLLAFREIKQENLNISIDKPDYYPKPAVNGQSISYCMALTRPCKIVFVGKGYHKFNKEKLISAGIRQYNTMKLCIEAMRNNPRAFEFAVLQKDVFDEPDDHNLFLKCLPWRVMVSSDKHEFNPSLQKLIELRRVTSAPGLKIEDSNAPEEMLKKCWDAWLTNRWQPPYTLNMYFDNSVELDKRYGSKADNLDESLSFSFQLGSQKSEVFEKKNSFDVFYDRHGRLRDHINANLHKKSLLQLSWEQIDKNNPDFDLIHNDKLKFPEISFSRLIESGIHKILVIDERAREAGLKITKSSPYLGMDYDEKTNNPYLRFAMAARVFIADSFLINDEEVLFDTGEISPSEDSSKFFQVKLKSKPEKQLSFNGQLSDRPDFNSLNIFSKFDTLIIHRTMLSKVEAKDLFDILDQNFPNIIITTGGGTLKYEPEIMNRSKMLPYAAVKKCLLNGAIAKNSISNLI